MFRSNVWQVGRAARNGGRGWPTRWQRRSLRFPLLLAVVVLLAGCGQQMANQPRYEPLEASTFFPDGSSSRHLVPNTVARGALRDDTLLYTGFEAPAADGEATQEEGEEVSTPSGDDVETGTGGAQRAVPSEVFPFEVDRAVLERGEERYNIYCAPCHNIGGYGDGMVVQRGYPEPPSLHIDRLRNAAPGYLYDVITNGIGVMPSYAGQIDVRDRWAIAAYVKVLQFSQNATMEDVPQDAVDQFGQQ